MVTATQEADIAHLRSEMQQLRADLAGIASALQDITRHGRDELVDQLQHSGDRLQQEVQAKLEAAAGQVRDKPMMAALASFLMGVLLGLLFGARRA